MKTFFDGLKKGIGHGLGIFLILGIVGIIYATVGNSWTNPDEIIASSGAKLSSDSWNKMLANMNSLSGKINSYNSVPTGAIMAFNSSACPTGWLEASGSNVPAGVGGNTSLNLRGEFLRGWDNGRGVDSGRILGSYQTGTSIAPAYNNLYNGSRNAYIPDDFPISDSDGSFSYSSTSGRSQINGITYYNDWTINKYKVRPRNVSVLYCVKQ